MNIYAFEITLGMIKFLDFYLFTVFYMFGSVDLQRVLLDDTIQSEFETLKGLSKSQRSDKIEQLISIIQSKKRYNKLGE